MTPRVIICVTALALLAGCSGSGGSESRGLVSQLFGSSGNTPDEFQVLPRKPLEAPPDYASLPEPTPGQPSLTDVDPRGDALAALGARGTGSPVVAADRALLAASGANRAPTDIRSIVAAEDEEFRSNNRGKLLERLLLRDREQSRYRLQLLDPAQEAERLRARGIKVPAFPPRTGG